MNDTDRCPEPHEHGEHSPSSSPTIPPPSKTPHADLDLAEMVGRLIAAVVANTREVTGMHETLRELNDTVKQAAERNEQTHQILAKGILTLHENEIELVDRLKMIESLPAIRRAIDARHTNGGNRD